MKRDVYHQLIGNSDQAMQADLIFGTDFTQHSPQERKSAARCCVDIDFRRAEGSELSLLHFAHQTGSSNLVERQASTVP